MPGATTKSAKLSVRVPLDLVEWMATQPGTTGEVVVRGLTTLKAGVPVGAGLGAAITEQSERIESLEATVKDMETTIERLTKDRDQWRERAKAIVSAGKEPLNAVATKTIPKQIGHHAAGPVLEPRLSVSGMATPRFRAGSEGEKALKSGR
jgi:outer membrane murein-binding lipoprotein Lpp